MIKFNTWKGGRLLWGWLEPAMEIAPAFMATRGDAVGGGW